jgi:hypothetical protein
MGKATGRAYASSSGVVLLAYHWKPASGQAFFGFSIKRTPGFWDPNSGTQTAFSWLPNRLNFFGPLDEDAPSKEAPIQKFMWWDARFHPEKDIGKTFIYEITPVGGTADKLVPVSSATKKLTLKLPGRERDGVSTWFNRPFVSSQAFSRLMQRWGVDPKSQLSDLSPKQREEILGWLSNDLHKSIVGVVGEKSRIDGAIYHFSDGQWLKAAFAKRAKAKTEIVLHWKKEGKKPKLAYANETLAKALAPNVKFSKRENVPGLMHDKILVLSKGTKPERVLMGSANFTTGALTSQANVVHVWDHVKLAEAYKERVGLLMDDPVKKDLTPAAWSKPLPMKGGASVRVFFPPEQGTKKSKGSGESIKPIIQAIKSAKSSVVFCFYSSTDDEVRNACIAAGKKGLMMYGLVNKIAKNPPKDSPSNKASVEIFKYSRKANDIVGATMLSPVPSGWLKEIFSIGAGDKSDPKKKQFRVPEVHIHHKFILIDGETSHPILYTGSANISGNSAYNNDESLLDQGVAIPCGHLSCGVLSPL